MSLSSTHPEGLSIALTAAFPTVPKSMLIGTSTPFITGRPVTLFHNDEIYSDGAVGLAITGESQSQIHVDLNVLEPVTEELTVAS